MNDKPPNIDLVRVHFRSPVETSTSVDARNVTSLYIDTIRDAVVIRKAVDPSQPLKPTTTIVPMQNVAWYWEAETKAPVIPPKKKSKGSK